MVARDDLLPRIALAKSCGFVSREAADNTVRPRCADVLWRDGPREPPDLREWTYEDGSHEFWPADGC